MPNRWKFQGQEHVDDLGLNWDSFKWRNHQPDIGRFFNIDPIAESYYYNSPYAFSENKVVAHIELEGLESKSIKEIPDKLSSKEEWKGLGRGFGKLSEKFVSELGKIKDGVKEVLRNGDKWVNGLKEGSEAVKDKQRQGDGVVDGNRPAEYNKDGTAEGGKGGKEVKTSSESNMEVENPDKPSAEVKIDTLWGPTRTHDDAGKDSTTTYQKYKTSDGQEGEKVIKKEKGSTPWL